MAKIRHFGQIFRFLHLQNAHFAPLDVPIHTHAQILLPPLHKTKGKVTLLISWCLPFVHVDNVTTPVCFGEINKLIQLINKL